MYRRRLNSCALVALAAVALIGGCRRPLDRSADRAEVQQAPPSLAALDSSASLLADVDNARDAIAEADGTAAANDLIQASTFAVSLPERAPSPSASHTAPTGLSAFEAEVMLTTAQSRLGSGDLAGADAGLAIVQQRASPRVASVDMPLLRADQSLSLARIAVEGQHPAELKTQLQTAETSLDAYRGRPHAADATALAGKIDRTLKQPGALEHLQPDRLDAWSGRVDGWG
jgi:hypothetical protein